MNMQLVSAAAAARSLPDIDPVEPLPDVSQIDDLLAEEQRKEVYNFLRKGGWKFGWKSSSKTDIFSFWHKHFAGYHNGRNEKQYDCTEELQKTAPLMFDFWLSLSATVFKGHTLIRCYANAQTHGSDGTIHIDSKSDKSYTSVYYPHERWEPNWAGETLIFNADKSDIIAAIYPKPNRLAIFRGNLPHVARGVSRICPELRITLMFKVNANDQG
jgi:SM-20-related protein